METEELDISVCGLNRAKCNLYHTNQCGKCRGSVEAHWSPDCVFLPYAREKGHRYCLKTKVF